MISKSNNPTYGDLRKIQQLNFTLVRFSDKLRVISENKREELFNWLKVWTPNNEQKSY